MMPRKISLLLANDDKDDCLIFKEALDELNIPTTLTVVHDGVLLLQLLKNNTGNLPDVIFLDLNMPRKNGSATLEEIKSNEKLKSIPVIIFSTSYDESTAAFLYKSGAQNYIRIPPNFSELKEVIHQAILLVSGKNSPPHSHGDFLLNPREEIPL